MVNSPYAYQLALYTADWVALGRAILRVDWEPAREWTRFTAVRSGRLPATAVDLEAAVAPIWHPRAGEPYVRGFRVAAAFDRCTVEHVFDAGYFAGLAERALETLAKRKGVETLDTAHYITTAYPAPGTASPAARPMFVACETAPDLTLQNGSLDEITARATPDGEATPGDVPVFLPERVLDELAELTGAAGERETGGILIGHLRRDSGRREVFTEVTAQIPARHTEASSTRLTFTAETWTEVRSALALRGRGEVMLGWWHSHPVEAWRKGCQAADGPACQAGAGFLSLDDRALHRAVFPRAYSLALVVSNTGPGRPAFALFGWREGVIARRGFSTLDTTPDECSDRPSPEAVPDRPRQERCRAKRR